MPPKDPRTSNPKDLQAAVPLRLGRRTIPIEEFELLADKFPGIGTIVRRLDRSALGLPDAQLEQVVPWMAIALHTGSLGFGRYEDFIALLSQDTPAQSTAQVSKEAATQTGLEFDAHNFRRLWREPYKALKAATEAFLLIQSGALPKSGTVESRKKALAAYERDLPDEVGGNGAFKDAITEFVTDTGPESKYLEKMIDQLVVDPGTLHSPFSRLGMTPYEPGLIELIWSYWMEEGMVVQAFSAITRRFQNIGSGRSPDPLTELELDPLRPLNAFIWGWIDDEAHRLSLSRRAYEYSHSYGLALVGRAAPRLSPADRRSRFMESFHTLLRQVLEFYIQDDDTTVVSDAFPVLHCLRDTHMLLAEGAHNQFRDLVWTARREMLIQQWLLARPEMREFLRGRLMVPYPETWMGAVDAMKRIQGWNDISSILFRDLAVFGERLLLSIRHTLWNDIQDPSVAKAWARYFREEVKGYVHAYQAATGVSFADGQPVDATLPGIHLARRQGRGREVRRIRNFLRP